ncbi:MAG: hypothetical protein WCV99_21045 [Sterolibacterium sp.]|jgi:hypothetical protein
MYIVAIGWIFVTLLMALTETSFIAGVLSFGCYGLLPLALFLWLFGTPQRRRNRLSRSTDPAQPPPSPNEAIDQMVGEPDRADAGTDQQHLL